LENIRGVVMSLGEKYEKGKMKMGKRSKEDRRKRENRSKKRLNKWERGKNKFKIAA
jgi:hypothetical protein